MDAMDMGKIRVSRGVLRYAIAPYAYNPRN